MNDDDSIALLPFAVFLGLNDNELFLESIAESSNFQLLSALDCLPSSVARDLALSTRPHHCITTSPNCPRTRQIDGIVEDAECLKLLQDSEGKSSDVAVLPHRLAEEVHGASLLRHLGDFESGGRRGWSLDRHRSLEVSYRICQRCRFERRL